MREFDYKWNAVKVPVQRIPVLGCICFDCVEARRAADAANHAHQPTDEELADAVRKSVQAMSSAVWAARGRGITVDFNVQTESEFYPVRAIPGTFVLHSIYREKTETVPASTKTVRVNL
jgi:hypothetical protein